MVTQLPKAAELELRGLVLGIFLISAAGCGQSQADLYPGPWIEEPSPSITRVLDAHGVACADVVYRPSNVSNGPRDPAGQFLVYCSNDGQNWSAWVARPALAADRNLVAVAVVFEDVPPPAR